MLSADSRQRLLATTLRAMDDLMNIDAPAYVASCIVSQCPLGHSAMLDVIVQFSRG